MLRELHLQQVGLASRFDINFANKLNIFTGDNGLGKSFLLDIAWWVLTANWAELPAFPRRVRQEDIQEEENGEKTPKIAGVVSNSKTLQEYQSYFDCDEQEWHIQTHLSSIVLPEKRNLLTLLRNMM
jgi:predicted ATP-binding protein involved in virulence